MMDSGLRLDLVHVPARHWRMAQDTVQYLVLERCDPSCNMARYYVLSIEPSLFADATLICERDGVGQPRLGSGRSSSTTDNPVL
jgi:hypothetical protein